MLSTGKLHHTRTCNMQCKVDTPMKNPPKAFNFLVATILLIFIIGLIFIIMALVLPDLQKTPEPMNNWDDAGPIDSEVLMQNLTGRADNLDDVEANINKTLTSVNNLDDVQANITNVQASITKNVTDDVKEMAEDAVEARPHNASCPPTWQKHGNRCFLYVREEKKWNDAEEYCVARGGHLASVHNQTTYDFIGGLSRHFLWLGGYRAVNEDGRWKWTDGSKFESKNAGYEHYRTTNLSVQECLEMWYRFGIKTCFCNLEHRFICQK
ncbi:C-type lectin domain family 10 member A-like isoform X2 [Dunckerocampus dactyliophorus]|uniref:C-type lectin domain family 10 member A-like isoform X2 n=1 Tax=Dunckerocampus dactyliophorus TaxID=161453 RepID=UPI002405FBF6|nr:C-type lectin domain family 10 member A-like isoform X2 [Dunckerocampus dactyliophorus]